MNRLSTITTCFCVFSLALAPIRGLAAPEKTGVPDQAEPAALSRQLPAGMVCRSGDLSVSTEQYRTAIKAALWGDRNSSAPTQAEAEDCVTRLLVGQALQREVDRLGAQADPAYKAAVKYATIESLAQAANAGMEVNVFSPDPPRELQNQLYEFYKTLGYVPQARFNFIFFRTAGLSDEQKKAKRELAEKTRRRITEGKEEFHKVMLEVSEAQTKNESNYLIGADAKNLDPKLWDTLASMKPLSVSDVIETPAGYQILYLDRSTVMRPKAKFDGWDLGEVDRFFFIQMFKAPINKFFLEYGAKTPVYLHSPSEPLPPGESVLVEVAGKRLTVGELEAIRKFRGQPALTPAELMGAQWIALQMFTLAERARHLGVDGITTGSLAYAQTIQEINERWLHEKARASKSEPGSKALRQFWEQWKESNGKQPVIAGWTVELKPAAPGKVSVIEVQDEIEAVRKRLKEGEDIEKLSDNYKSDRFKLVITRQEPALLGMLRETNPAWPEEPPAGSKPVVSIPNRLADGYAVYVVTERRSADDWKMKALEPMIKELWRMQESQKVVEAIVRGVREHLELDRAQLTVTPAQMKEIAASVPPAPPKSK